jgi:hypothetical protein
MHSKVFVFSIFLFFCLAPFAGADFTEICATATDPGVTQPVDISYYVNSASLYALQNLEPGDIEAVHFIPEHPFRLQEIRLFLYDPNNINGEVEIHVYGDYGRSWSTETTEGPGPISTTI